MGKGVIFRIRDPDGLRFSISDPDELKLKILDPVVKSDLLPGYDGPYEITPTDTVQILDTKNRVLSDVIKVNPVPQNYGRITYNGAYILIT